MDGVAVGLLSVYLALSLVIGSINLHQFCLDCGCGRWARVPPLRRKTHGSFALASFGLTGQKSAFYLVAELADVPGHFLVISEGLGETCTMLLLGVAIAYVMEYSKMLQHVNASFSYPASMRYVEPIGCALLSVVFAVILAVNVDLNPLYEGLGCVAHAVSFVAAWRVGRKVILAMAETARVSHATSVAKFRSVQRSTLVLNGTAVTIKGLFAVVTLVDILDGKTTYVGEFAPRASVITLGWLAAVSFLSVYFTYTVFIPSGKRSVKPARTEVQPREIKWKERHSKKKAAIAPAIVYAAPE